MVPIVGLVGIGLLFFGIKVLFVSDKEEPYREYVRQEAPENQWEIAGPVGLLPPKNQIDGIDGGLIAVPVLGDGSSQPSKPAVRNNASSRPAKPSQPSAPKPSKPSKPSQPRPSQAKPQVPSGPSSWFVQIGSFRQKSSAETVVSGAKAKGISATVGSGNVNGVMYYKVWVPGGKTREQAVALGEKLKTMGYDYFVFAK